MPGGASFDAQRLAQRVRNGDPMALGRALTRAENGGADARALLSALDNDSGQAKIVGFTGPPGAGKSTLVDALIREWRNTGQRVAVLAVDPVSPVSGGAVLGDRTRMGVHSLDDGVFIRSVCARGHLGGLSAATHDMASVMDAAGWPLIIIETVGAGQSETEIASVADLTAVILAPGLGDDLQAIKAGILEIGDILVVNKADRNDSEKTAKQLQGMLALRSGERADVPVLRVSATTGQGVSELRKTVDEQLATAAPVHTDKRRTHQRHVRAQQLASQLATQLSDKDLAALDADALQTAIQQALAISTKKVNE